MTERSISHLLITRTYWPARTGSRRRPRNWLEPGGNSAIGGKSRKRGMVARGSYFVEKITWFFCSF